MQNHMGMELLAPAGSPDILKAVINAGADAIYVGGDKFGARAYAANFSSADLLWAIDYAHLFGRKLYLTVNTLLKNKEIEKDLYDYILPLYEAGLDAVLVQDYGVLKYLRKYFPELPIHISTQMTVCSKESVRFLHELGAERVVLSRELSLEEMKEIHDQTGVELEAFVHGALCYSYSGMCLFSSLLGGRSGNRGRCAQPCRLAYDCMENNKLLGKDKFYLSLKDFCAYEKIQELKNAGIYSLKIEGRMKQAEYAYSVVKAYADALSNNGKSPEKNSFNELKEYGNRGGFTDSYLYKKNDEKMITYNDSSLHKGDHLLQADFSEQKLPVQGFITLLKGQESQLTVNYNDKYIEITGAIVAEAKNKPLIKDDVIERLNKTGTSNFKFENLEVSMDPDIFVPNGALNALRRDALDALKEAILFEYRRDGKILSLPEKECSYKNQSNESPYFSAEITSRNQLDPLLENNLIQRIYLPATAYVRKTIFSDLEVDVEKCKKSQKEVFFVFPTVLRNRHVKFFEENRDSFENLNMNGYMVGSSDSLALAKRLFPYAKIAGDYSLYSFNNFAVNQLNELGCNTLTAPLELNKAELSHRDNLNSEMIIYGRYPLMQTANCTCKNTKGCTHTPEFLTLKDRYKAQFLVRNNCSFCYNTIYNSLPTNLLGQLNELISMGFDGYRLCFVDENQEQINKTLRVISDVFLRNVIYNNSKEYTSGHYKRGVE